MNSDEEQQNNYQLTPLGIQILLLCIELSDEAEG